MGPGDLPIGVCLCVQVKGGRFLIDGMRNGSPQVGQFQGLFMQTQVDIWEALQTLDCAAWSWLYVQVLLQLATVIEAKIIAGCATNSMIPTTCMPAVANTPKGNKKLKALAKALSARKQKAIRTRVCKYFLCGRRAFDSGGSISLTCDASRIGKRQCMVSTVGKPGNVLMWAPPQADMGGGLGLPMYLGRVCKLSRCSGVGM